MFDVPKNITPTGLLKLAEDCGWKLWEEFFYNLSRNKASVKEEKSISWGTRKTTRDMFLQLCKIDPQVKKDEFDRVLHATRAKGYKNLILEIHRYRFRIEGKE